jgi:F-type H+-transporting ATPase subunit delta
MMAGIAAMRGGLSRHAASPGPGCASVTPVLEPAALSGRVARAGVWSGKPAGEGAAFQASHGDPLLSSRENQESSYVAAAEKGVSGLADRYAAALFDLADERKALDAVAGDLESLRAMLRDSADLRRLIRSPVLTREVQGKGIAALAELARVSPLTRNFLGLLAQNRRLFALPDMIGGFLRRLAERRGEVTAHVLTAQDLSPAQREAVNGQLRKAVGRKVAVDIEVDPSLLGGMVVRVGSRMVDGSLKSKLHRLQLAMKGVE